MNPVDPSKITDYNRSQYELEAFWLFCILAAGKSAKQQAFKLNEFVADGLAHDMGPFEYIQYLDHYGNLEYVLKRYRFGQYTRILIAFRSSMTLDLLTASVSDLESVYGVGPKTARFFILHSRRGTRHAVLDTHVLKWLRKTFTNVVVPKSTPSAGKRYSKLEKLFLDYCDENEYDPAEFDLSIWNSYQRA